MRKPAFYAHAKTNTDQLRVYLISAFVFAIDFEVPIGPGAPCRGFL